jgi:hypothetical protein
MITRVNTILEMAEELIPDTFPHLLEVNLIFQ